MYRPTRTHLGAVTNGDLRRLVVREARSAARRVGKLPPDLIPREDVPRVLHAYVVQYVPYVEDDDLQSIRRPAALVHGYSGDCKSTAIFIGSLAKKAGCDVVLRFAAYPETGYFSHVYAVVDGVPVDPLLPFGHEEPYIRKEDHEL
jgi:hypothetical protein